ncbi:unnamed protein product, partial [Effrenium voratum]
EHVLDKDCNMHSDLEVLQAMTRQAFIKMSETCLNGIRPTPDGVRPLDAAMANVCNDSTVVLPRMIKMNVYALLTTLTVATEQGQVNVVTVDVASAA